MVVEFVKPDTVNGKEYKVGDTLSVGGSWYKTLKESGSVKDYVEPKKEFKPKEEK